MSDSENESTLRDDLEKLLDRWQSDIETLEEAEMNRKAGRLKQDHAEVRHFLSKHTEVDR